MMGYGATRLTHPTSLLHQLDQRVKRAVHRRSNAQPFAFARDIPVEMLDLRASRPRNVLCGRRGRPRHHLGEVERSCEHIVRQTNAFLLRKRHHFLDHVGHEFAYLGNGHHRAVTDAADRRKRIVGAIEHQLGPELGFNVFRNACGNAGMVEQCRNVFRLLAGAAEFAEDDL
jgi:hypothetical protein